MKPTSKWDKEYKCLSILIDVPATDPNQCLILDRSDSKHNMLLTRPNLKTGLI